MFILSLVLIFLIDSRSSGNAGQLAKSTRHIRAVHANSLVSLSSGSAASVWIQGLVGR